MITSNANRLAVGMERRGEKYLKEISAATKKNTKAVYTKARQFSQRRFASLADLRRMGHPYARRRPGRLPVAAHIINKQLGKFHRSWHWNFIVGTNKAQGTIWNAAKYARFMLGTKYMIERPILKEALKRTKSERNQNIKAARGKAYRPAIMGGL